MAHRSTATNGGIFSIFTYAALLGGFAMAFCQWLIFVYAPIEEHMRLPQKIFYLHLPLAWWGLISFFLVFIASIAFLRSGKSSWDALAGAAAEIGLVLASLAVISGMIWGKPAWGVWWSWDARLTTSLVMCFVYAGYLILRTMDIEPGRRSRIAAVVGIIAFLDVPLVYMSARLWSYLHPPSISLDPAMKLTLFVCLGSFALFWAGLIAFRWRQICDERRLDAIAMERVLQKEAESAIGQ